MRQFPMHSRGKRSYEKDGFTVPASTDWDLIAPHEKQAKRNHGQSLETLARRGGLSPPELLAVLTDRHWHDVEQLSRKEVMAQLSEALL